MNAVNIPGFSADAALYGHPGIIPNPLPLHKDARVPRINAPNVSRILDTSPCIGRRRPDHFHCGRNIVAVKRIQWVITAS
jgi:hypothetical protein